MNGPTHDEQARGILPCRDVLGMYSGCIRDVLGMYLGCTRDVLGMYLRHGIFLH